MKRTFLILLCLFVTFGASAEEQPETGVKSNEEKVIEYVLGGSAFETETVTRGEFVSAAVKLMGYSETLNTKEGFKDVKKDSPINTALSLEWISEGEKFEPQNEMALNEAVKVAVSALGYKVAAQAQGGYPSGYIAQANKIRLLQGVSGTLNTESAYKLLFNMVNAKRVNPVGLGESTQYETEEETVLESVHSIYMRKGILTADNFTSLISDKHADGYIAVDGMRIKYDGECTDMLGMKCKVYYTYDDINDIKEAFLLISETYEKIIVPINKITDIKDGKIEYEENEKDENASIDKSCYTIYNGKKAVLSKELLKENSGYAILSDNDDDGTYDTVNISAYEYLTVKSVDYTEESITDKNGSAYALYDLDEKDFRVYAESGEELTIYDIKADMIFRVVKSEDGRLIKLYGITPRNVTGNGDYYEDGILCIDGTEYGASKYFKDNFADKLKLGGVVSAAMDGEFVISMEDAENKYSYGYAVNAAPKANIDEDIEMKIFTSGAEMKVFKLASRVSLDGGSSVSAKTAVDKLKNSGEFEPQLIRYLLDSEGKIKKIDTASDIAPAIPGEYENNDDALVRYSFPAEPSYWYRVNSGVVSGRFNLMSTMIFRVPSDVTEEELFRVGTRSDFGNGLITSSTSTFEVYNLKKNGSPEVVVYRNTDISVGKGSASGVISKIYKGTDSEGEIYNMITLCGENGYGDFCVKDDVSLLKSSGKTLCPGDVIRYVKDGKNRITGITVDFDSEKMEPDNTASAGYFNFNGNDSLCFMTGYVYISDGGYVLVSNSKDDNGNPDYSIGNMRNFPTNTNNVIIYNKKTKTIRPGSASDIKTYVSDGGRADYILVKQDYYIPRLIVIYREG